MARSSSNPGHTSVSSVISGLGSVTQGGTGTVALSGYNAYAGATAINSGTVQTGSANALGFGGASVGINTPVAVAAVNSTATLDLNGQVLNKPITLNGGTLTNSLNSSTAGILTGVGGYVVTSPGSGIEADLAQVTNGGVTALNGTGASLKLLLGVTNANVTFLPEVLIPVLPTVTITGGGGYGANGNPDVVRWRTGTLMGSTSPIPAADIIQPRRLQFRPRPLEAPRRRLRTTKTTSRPSARKPSLPARGYTSVPTVTPFAIDSTAGVSTEVLPTVTADLNNVNLQPPAASAATTATFRWRFRSPAAGA